MLLDNKLKGTYVLNYESAHFQVGIVSYLFCHTKLSTAFDFKISDIFLDQKKCKLRFASLLFFTDCIAGSHTSAKCLVLLSEKILLKFWEEFWKEKSYSEIGSGGYLAVTLCWSYLQIPQIVLPPPPFLVFRSFAHEGWGGGEPRRTNQDGCPTPTPPWPQPLPPSPV